MKSYKTKKQNRITDNKNNEVKLLAFPAVTYILLDILGNICSKKILSDISPLKNEDNNNKEPKLKLKIYFFINLSKIELDQKNRIGKIIEDVLIELDQLDP